MSENQIQSASRYIDPMDGKDRLTAIPDSTPAERIRAVRAVASRACDAADAEMLLSVLGLVAEAPAAARVTSGGAWSGRG